MDISRLWVSKKKVDGYCSRFENHFRKKELLILKTERNEVHYTLRTSMEQNFSDYFGKLPIDIFLNAYEPFQNSMQYIAYQNGNPKQINYSQIELLDFLTNLMPSRIIG